jgi:hypothetical protein
VPIWRANYLFRAVPVDAGSHRVRFAYRDARLAIGAWISALGLGVSLILWGALGQRQKGAVRAAPSRPVGLN